MSEVLMFIYCDDASHPQRVAVDKFLRLPGPAGLWVRVERRPGKPARGRRSRAVALIGDSPIAPVDSTEEAALARELTVSPADAAGKPSAHRFMHSLVCRKCKRRPVEVRAENLFPILDALARRRVSEVPLTLIAAMLRRQSRSG